MTTQTIALNTNVSKLFISALQTNAPFAVMAIHDDFMEHYEKQDNTDNDALLLCQEDFNALEVPYYALITTLEQTAGQVGIETLQDNQDVDVGILMPKSVLFSISASQMQAIKKAIAVALQTTICVYDSNSAMAFVKRMENAAVANYFSNLALDLGNVVFDLPNCNEQGEKVDVIGFRHKTTMSMNIYTYSPHILSIQLEVSAKDYEAKSYVAISVDIVDFMHGMENSEQVVFCGDLA